MRDLSLNECHFISGANASRGSESNADMLGFGTLLGLVGGTMGGIYGYSQDGILSGVGGAVGGALLGAVGIPVMVIGTGIFVGTVYHYLGLININKL